jgi:(E)-4-hydroxy-3-methylbut-2-enyl-diphosphate synthase
MNSKNGFNIGNVAIGGDAPVVVQSMTNTDTNNVEATVEQCRRMVESGAQMVRITVPSLKEVAAMREIKSRLRSEGINTPLVADVHFNPKVAEEMADLVEKVRINPGNYVDKRNFSQCQLSDAAYQEAVDRMARRAAPLLQRCADHGTALRIGINHGSLCDRIVNRYGNTPEAMVQSALEWIDICDSFGFRKTVISMKSSNVRTATEATLLLKRAMEARGCDCPLHIGITEAGNGLEGRVKSAAGIGAMLLCGVGDTVRVSLTEPPENESPFAHRLVQAVQGLDPKQGIVQAGVMRFADNDGDEERFMIKAAALTGYASHFNRLGGVEFRNSSLPVHTLRKLEQIVMQACRIKMSKTEFIACPSCGRTQYDIEQVFAIVKERFPDCPGLKLAVMGCVVNGPGEMADADFGIVGASHGLVCVYKGKTRLTEAIAVPDALRRLERLIEEHFRQSGNGHTES